MKIKILAFIIAVAALASPQFIQAQALSKLDTVYYLVDTAKIPLQDRLITPYQESGLNYYVFKCYCYVNSPKALFSYPADRKSTYLTKKQFKEKNLISLSTLLGIINQFSIDRKTKHEFFFLEPSKTGLGYDRRQVFLNHVYTKKLY